MLEDHGGENHCAEGAQTDHTILEAIRFTLSSSRHKTDGKFILRCRYVSSNITYYTN